MPVEARGERSRPPNQAEARCRGEAAAAGLVSA